MRVERIEADYLIETAYDLATAVAAMAGEQSSGTFVPVPGETLSSRLDQPPGLRNWKRSASWTAQAFLALRLPMARATSQRGRRFPGRSTISDHRCRTSWPRSREICSS